VRERFRGGEEREQEQEREQGGKEQGTGDFWEQGGKEQGNWNLEFGIMNSEFRIAMRGG